MAKEEIKVQSWMECRDWSAGKVNVQARVELVMAMGTGFPPEVYCQHASLACVWCIQFCYESVEGSMNKEGWEDECGQTYGYREYIDFGWVALQKGNIVQGGVQISRGMK